MKELITFLLKALFQITQRAAWPISFILQKQIPKLQNELLNTRNKHESVNLNILCAFQLLNLPEKHEKTF